MSSQMYGLASETAVLHLPGWRHRGRRPKQPLSPESDVRWFWAGVTRAGCRRSFFSSQVECLPGSSFLGTSKLITCHAEGAFEPQVACIPTTALSSQQQPFMRKIQEFVEADQAATGVAAVPKTADAVQTVLGSYGKLTRLYGVRTFTFSVRERCAGACRVCADGFRQTFIDLLFPKQQAVKSQGPAGRRRSRYTNGLVHVQRLPADVLIPCSILQALQWLCCLRRYWPTGNHAGLQPIPGRHPSACKTEPRRITPSSPVWWPMRRFFLRLDEFCTCVACV